MIERPRTAAVWGRLAFTDMAVRVGADYAGRADGRIHLDATGKAPASSVMECWKRVCSISTCLEALDAEGASALSRSSVHYMECAPFSLGSTHERVYCHAWPRPFSRAVSISDGQISGDAEEGQLQAESGIHLPACKQDLARFAWSGRGCAKAQWQSTRSGRRGAARCDSEGLSLPASCGRSPPSAAWRRRTRFPSP